MTKDGRKQKTVNRAFQLWLWKEVLGAFKLESFCFQHLRLEHCETRGTDNLGDPILAGIESSQLPRMSVAFKCPAGGSQRTEQ